MQHLTFPLAQQGFRLIRFQKAQLQSVSIFFKAIVFAQKFAKYRQSITKNLIYIKKELFPPVLSFVFAVLFKPSFNVLSGYFYASLNLVAVSTV